MTRWRHKQSRIMHKAQHRKQRELRKRQEKIKDLRAMHQNAIDAMTKSRDDKLAMALRARRAPPRVCAAPAPATAPATAPTVAARSRRVVSVGGLDEHIPRPLHVLGRQCQKLLLLLSFRVE